MHLSTNRKYHQAKISSGFEVVQFDDRDEYKKIVIFDHAPAIFTDGIRKGANVQTCDCLIMDVDNTDGDEVTQEDFEEIFKSIKFYLNTSRSHQIEKPSGELLPYPPRDRYHACFPLGRDVTKTEYEMVAKRLCNQYQFFDRACTDASRFLFGFKDTEVRFHEGEFLGIDEIITPKFHETQGDFKYETTNNFPDDAREKIMSALQIAVNRGALDNYAEWIKLGMAMKADGWSISDWKSLLSMGKPSDSMTLQEADYKWSTFSSNGVTGGTVMHYARLGEPTCLVKGISVVQQAISKKPEAIEIRDVSLPTLSQPCRVEHRPSDIMVEKVKKLIWHLDEDGKKKLNDSWPRIVTSHDIELANCVHYDYTTGDKLTSYRNDDLLNDAIIDRLIWYGIPMTRISELAIKRIKDKAQANNQTRNMVIETMDRLAGMYEPNKSHGSELDEFMALMDFTVPMEAPYTQDQLRIFYKEVWHLFFLRMHFHIEGTRLENHNYKGLMPNDIVPILQGAQNLGKTTLTEYIALKHLNERFYVDLGSGEKGTFGSMQTAKECRGRILAELGEMKIMKRSDAIETVKSFISKSQYDYDVKYQEKGATVPVTISFIGTSNDLEYLSDTTGNRRWWPVWLKSIDKQKMGDNPEIIERLHAFYANMVRGIPFETRFKYLEKSSLLDNFMNEARGRSMIRNIDHDCIVEVVGKEYQEACDNFDMKRAYHNITSAGVKKLMIINGYGHKLNVEMIKSAMEAMGYKQKTISVSGASIWGWSKKLFRPEY